MDGYGANENLLTIEREESVGGCGKGRVDFVITKNGLPSSPNPPTKNTDLESLHTNDYVHGDIRAYNMVLNYDESDSNTAANIINFSIRDHFGNLSHVGRQFYYTVYIYIYIYINIPVYMFV